MESRLSSPSSLFFRIKAELMRRDRDSLLTRIESLVLGAFLLSIKGVAFYPHKIFEYSQNTPIVLFGCWNYISGTIKLQHRNYNSCMVLKF